MAVSSASSIVPQESASSILTALRGQSIVLPDLNAILAGWTKEINQNYDRLRLDLNDWLDGIMKNSSKLESLKAADFAYFGATFWPRASYGRLRIVTFLVAWMFIWDDEIDMDTSYMWDNVELVHPHTNETRDYVQACLGLTSDPHLDPIKSGNTTIQAFETIGTAIREAYNFEQRKRFMDHFEDCMVMARQEQILRLRETLPSVEEFLLCRPGSSAGHLIVAVNEFASESKGLPKSVMEDGNMKLIWHYTNTIIGIVNDIFSLKKEVAHGSISSIIPLLYVQSKDVQMAVDQTTDFLVANVRAFEEAKRQLLKPEQRRSTEEALQLHDFIMGCQFNCSGNLSWSLVTHRYGIYEKDLTTGIRVTL